MQEDDRLVLEFYGGTGSDHMGRKLDDILNKDDDWLETSHDYIQWLFPLYVASRFNPHAPLLSDEIRAAFTDLDAEQSEMLNRNFILAFSRMLSFFGYSVFHWEKHTVSETTDWNRQSVRWLSSGNHNHLRITRILRSATLLGHHTIAMSFREALRNTASKYPHSFSPETLKLWDEAVTLPKG